MSLTLMRTIIHIDIVDGRMSGIEHAKSRPLGKKIKLLLDNYRLLWYEQ